MAKYLDYTGLTHYDEKIKEVIDNKIDAKLPTDYLTGGSQTTTSKVDGGDNIFTFTKSTGQTATFTVKNGTKGSQGETGPQGDAATVAVGTTTTGEPGTQASVTNSGTSAAAVFNFVIPKGEKGDKGDKGADGTSITVKESEAACTKVGDGYIDDNGHLQILSTLTPRTFTDAGEIKGPKGDTGAKGDTGTAAGFGNATATVDANVGTPSVTVSTSGPDTAKVFAFTFKNLKGVKGDAGDKGDTGATGPQGIGISTITAGTPTQSDGYTVTPITVTKTDETTQSLSIRAKNGTDPDLTKYPTLGGVNVFEGTNTFNSLAASNLYVGGNTSIEGSHTLAFKHVGKTTSHSVSLSSEGYAKNENISITLPDASGTLALQENVDSKFDKSGGSIGGDVVITGDLTVNGTQHINNTENLNVENAMIYSNAKGATLATNGGIGIKTNSTDVYGIVYDPTSDSVKLGLGTSNASGVFTFSSGEGSPVAIRDESTALTNDHLLKWDSATNKIKDGGEIPTSITNDEIDKLFQ